MIFCANIAPFLGLIVLLGFAHGKYLLVEVDGQLPEQRQMSSAAAQLKQEVKDRCSLVKCFYVDILCETHDNGRKEISAGGHVVSINVEFTTGVRICKWGTSYGQKGDKIWCNNGCSALLNVVFIKDCVSSDQTAGDGTDQGTCNIGELCTAAGTCLGCVGNDNTAGDGTNQGSCNVGKLCTAAGTCLGCVGNDRTAGDGTDRGTCNIGELCTAAGTCLAD